MGYRLNRPDKLARVMRDSDLCREDREVVLEELGLLEKGGRPSNEPWGSRQQRLDRAVDRINRDSTRACEDVIFRIP